MKKTILMTLMLIASIIVSAQQKDVTKFLGIPIDGTKTAMIQKLKAKGFVYNSRLGCLKGEFNGANVYVHVVTKNNKVWRIMVSDEYAIGETDIRIRFNNLCGQFEKNKKYMNASVLNSIYYEGVEETNYMLPDDEDISYNMTVKNKRYEASYYQEPAAKDSVEIAKEARAYLLTKFSEEQLLNPTDQIKAEIMQAGIAYMRDVFTKKSVWFMISEEYGKYRILMYYDNMYNNNEGEDL